MAMKCVYLKEGTFFNIIITFFAMYIVIKNIIVDLKLKNVNAVRIFISTNNEF